MTSPSSQGSEPKKNFQEKFKENLDHFKSNVDLNKIASSATANVRDSVSYVILIVAIIMLFFYKLSAGLIIGVISGLYFSSEALAFFQASSQFIEGQGIVKSLIAGGLLLSLFISAPTIFIGFALAIAARQILFPEK